MAAKQTAPTKRTTTPLAERKAPTLGARREATPRQTNSSPSPHAHEEVRSIAGRLAVEWAPFSPGPSCVCRAVDTRGLDIQESQSSGREDPTSLIASEAKTTASWPTSPGSHRCHSGIPPRAFQVENAGARISPRLRAVGCSGAGHEAAAASASANARRVTPIRLDIRGDGLSERVPRECAPACPADAHAVCTVRPLGSSTGKDLPPSSRSSSPLHC